MLDYVSPAGKLAEFFRSSRDRWKARSAKSQQKIKALDGKVRDLTVSRDAWKAKANDLKRELEDSRRTDSGRLADNAATQRTSKNTTAGKSAATKAQSNASQTETLPGTLARRVVTGELLDENSIARQNALQEAGSPPLFLQRPAGGLG